jgi:hypothetical protein
MGSLMFFAAAIAACLLWTAAFTAAAARTNRGWLRSLLASIGAGVPVLTLLPLLAGTWWLAFVVRVTTNWFPHVLTVFLAALVGGLVITRAGLVPTSEDDSPPAARWPLVGLAALFVIAKAVCGGVLLILDNAVAAQAPYLRLEAAQLMQSNLAPPVADDDNAAPLHQQAAAAIAAETTFAGEDSPLAKRAGTPGPETAAFLARHAATLDLVRRAADRDACRFVRDWTRPSLDMLLPEVQALRTEGRLLALAARQAAADGRGGEALADVVRIGRLGRHAAAEPILISALVGMALDSIALETLADVLPTLTAADLPALEDSAVRDLISRPPTLTRALYGEEAFGLSMFAGFADNTLGAWQLIQAVATGDAFPAPAAAVDFGPGFRVFFLPADLAGYRQLMHRYQQLAARQPPPDYAEAKRETEAIERDITTRPPGVLTRLIAPSIGAVFRSRLRADALRRSATFLVAATKHRLRKGAVPESLDSLVPDDMPSVPRDPFAEGKPLVLKWTDAAVVAYSVGPDGEDDGGPVAPGAAAVEGNDDVGLVMQVGGP